MNRREFSSTGLFAFLLSPIAKKAIVNPAKSEKSYMDMLFIGENLPLMAVSWRKIKTRSGLETVSIIAETKCNSCSQADRLVKALNQWRTDWLKFNAPFDKKKHGWLQRDFTVTEACGDSDHTVSVSYSYIRLTGKA